MYECTNCICGSVSVPDCGEEGCCSRPEVCDYCEGTSLDSDIMEILNSKLDEDIRDLIKSYVCQNVWDFHKPEVMADFILFVGKNM